MKNYIRQYSGLVIAGIIIASGFIYTYFDFIHNNSIKDRLFINIPSDKELLLEAGKYTIFYEYNERNQKFGPIQIIKNNRITRLSELIDLTVVNLSNDEEVSNKEDPSMTYTIKEVKGESLYSFDVIQEGSYKISTKLQSNGMEDSITLTLISDFTGSIFLIFKTIGTFILISIPFLVIGFIYYHKEGKRKRNKR